MQGYLFEAVDNVTGLHNEALAKAMEVVDEEIKVCKAKLKLLKLYHASLTSVIDGEGAQMPDKKKLKSGSDKVSSLGSGSMSGLKMKIPGGQSKSSFVFPLIFR